MTSHEHPYHEEQQSLAKKAFTVSTKRNCFSLICYFLGDRFLQELINNMNGWGYLTFKVDVRSMSSTSQMFERILGIADVIIVSLNEIFNLLPDYHSTGYMFLHHGITKITLTWGYENATPRANFPIPHPLLVKVF